MRRTQLGNSGIEVSELCFGSLILGRLQAHLTLQEAEPALKTALEMGVDFFDTAQSYGTQEHLCHGLGTRRNDVVMATKTHERTRKGAQGAFESSLRELRREYIDIYHFHLIDSAEDMANRQEVHDYLLELKDRGLIRAIGASVHKVEAARVVAGHPGIDVLFPVLNSHGLGIIDGSAQEMIEACQEARDNGQGVYAMKPLGGGHLREAPKEAFDFLRSTGVVDSICAGMKSAAEVEMNVRLLEGREVPEEILDLARSVSRTLRIYPRCIGCGACVDACDQGALTLDVSQANASIGKKGQAVVDHDKCILCGYCADGCPQFTIRVI